MLITGYDILFFWVARMVMSGLTWMEDIPFKAVYFNSLVRDEHGAKMSKTKGNVIDPLETMDEYGTDALRFSLAIMAAPGTDISLSTSRLEASRNFCNKLWNAARFVQMSLDPEVTLEVEPELGEAEHWMIRRLREDLQRVTDAIESFRFHEAAEVLYHLVWDDFCATYIELAKVHLQKGTRGQKAAILHFLDILLRALHPLVPFVTEEIHEAVMAGRLRRGEPELLAARSWPMDDALLKVEGGDPSLVPIFQDALSSLLRLKSEQGVDPGKRVPALCTLGELEPFADALKSLARLESLVCNRGGPGLAHPRSRHRGRRHGGPGAGGPQGSRRRARQAGEGARQAPEGGRAAQGPPGRRGLRHQGPRGRRGEDARPAGGEAGPPREGARPAAVTAGPARGTSRRWRSPGWRRLPHAGAFRRHP